MSRLLRGAASALRVRDAPDGEDTGRRIMHGQVVESLGVSWDQKWAYVVAPAGDGWAHLDYLEEVPHQQRRHPDPTWPRVPHGKLEIIEVFGDPCAPVATRGEVRLPESLPLYLPGSPVTTQRFVCHELMVGPFEAVFTEIHRRGHWRLLEDWGGVYNCRLKRGTRTKKSTHSWGIAVDVASFNNPLGRTPTLDPRIVAIFEDVGFAWGGRWSRPDGMHFQWATGY